MTTFQSMESLFAIRFVLDQMNYEKVKMNKRIIYTGLDIGKFLCALLILFYHYFSEHGGLPGILDEVLSLYAVAVALFMAISGFLAFSKLENISTLSKRWSSIKYQVIRILKIYALWSIPYLIFNISCWDYSTLNPSFVFWEIQGWIFNSTFYTIWFMPMLAIGLIFTFWITEKFPAKITLFLAILMYAMGSLTMTYSYFGCMIPGYDLISDFADTWLGGSRGWLFYAFPLLMLGRSIAKSKKKLECMRALLLSVISLVCLVTEALVMRKIAGHTGIDMAIFMVPTVYFLLIFLTKINLPSGYYSLWMRKMSTVIFMSQRLFLTVLPALLPTIFFTVFTNSIIGVVVVCGSVITFSAIIISMSNKWRFLQNLY